MPIKVLTGAKPATVRQVLQATIEATGIGERFEFVSTDSTLPGFMPEDIVLALGDRGLNVLREQGVVPKNRTVGTLHDQLFHDDNGTRYLVSYDPGLVFQDWSKRPWLQWAINLSSRVEKHDTIAPKLGHYEYVDDLNPVIERITAQHEPTGKPVPIAIDLETVGLDPYREDRWIVAIQVSEAEGRASVMYLSGREDHPCRHLHGGNMHEVWRQRIWAQLDWLLNSGMVSVRGANLKYDLLWLKLKCDLDCTRFRFDTTLVGSLLDENRSNSLNLHTKIYVPDLGGYDESLAQKYDKSQMHKIPKADLLPYAGGDTDATLRVSNIMRQELLDRPKLANFYVKLLHPASRVFEKMERRGIYVDAERYESLAEEVGSDMQEHLHNAYKMVPHMIRLKHSTEPTLKPKIIEEFMFGARGLRLEPKMLTAKSQQPSTAMQHLEMFEDDPDAAPFLAELKAYKAAEKTYTTYVKGFQQCIRSDGMFHPEYFLHRGEAEDLEGGTVTGRSSAKRPAYQTIPVHTKWASKLREVFIPPPGYVILSIDFSQGELRVMACVGQINSMIHAYLKGMDLHLITGCTLNDIPLDEGVEMKQSTDPDVKARIKQIRQGGKAGNFGLIYGMQAAGFMAYARKSYGVHLTLDQASAFREKFLYETWPEIPGYHERAVAYARKQGQIDSPLGRVRHLPLINSRNWEVRGKQERQAINAPIQSTLSDLTQLAMVEIDRRHPDLHLFGMTHDSISFYVPEDQYMEWARELTGIMESLPLAEFGWNPALPFPAEAEVSVHHMGEKEELDLAV